MIQLRFKDMDRDNTSVPYWTAFGILAMVWTHVLFPQPEPLKPVASVAYEDILLGKLQGFDTNNDGDVDAIHLRRFWCPASKGGVLRTLRYDEHDGEFSGLYDTLMKEK